MSVGDVQKRRKKPETKNVHHQSFIMLWETAPLAIPSFLGSLSLSVAV